MEGSTPAQHTTLPVKAEVIIRDLRAKPAFTLKNRVDDFLVRAYHSSLKEKHNSKSVDQKNRLSKTENGISVILTDFCSRISYPVILIY